MEKLVPLLVAVPLGMGFAIAIIAHLKQVSRLTVLLATVAIAFNLLAAIILWRAVHPGSGHVISVWAGGWDGVRGPVGIQLVCDGLSRLMLIVINLVALVSIIFSRSYMTRFTSTWLFYSLFLLMTAAMNGVVLTGDLFNLFVFIEVAAIASYGLVAFGCESEELEAAFKYMVLGVVASSFILIGVTILYSLTGQLNMAKVSEGISPMGSTPAVLLAAVCLISGLALKSAMVPFHAWLPDAHPSAPAPISAMLSGVLIKACGIYAIARIVFNVLGATPQYAGVLIVLGTASMVLGMLMAMGQWDLKRLLAYSSISQAGYIVLALGVAAEAITRPTPNATVAGLCLFGGLFHLFNHATFKSLLFLCSGSIEREVGTREMREMGGLTQRMPVTALCCRIGALSIAGVPPFNGFFSKLIIIIALGLAHQYVLCAIAAAVAVGTLLMYVKVQRYVLEGAPGEKVGAAHEAPVPMVVAVVILAVICVGAGLAVGPLKRALFDPAGEALLKGTATAARIAMGGAP